MNLKVVAVIILTYLTICSSCSNKQYQILFQKRSNLIDSTYSQTESVSDYLIKPQDILQVRDLQESSKYLVNTTPAVGLNVTPLPGNGETGSSQNTNGNQDYQVESDGSVILPALGHIKVAGYTRVQAQKIVEDAYRKNVLQNPIIELKIVNLKVTLFGEVKAQGDVLLTKERTSLVEVIGAAGGITERADESNIEIIRGTQRNPKVTIVDLTDIQSINDPKAILQNGDIIYVRQNKRAAKADNYQNFTTTIFQPAILLLNTALIIFTLIHR